MGNVCGMSLASSGWASTKRLEETWRKPSHHGGAGDGARLWHRAPVPTIPTAVSTHGGAHLLQGLLVDRVAQLHLAVERVLLIVVDEVHKALELSRAAQHEEPTFLLDAAVLDLPLCPGAKRAGGRGYVKGGQTLAP